VRGLTEDRFSAYSALHYCAQQSAVCYVVVGLSHHTCTHMCVIVHWYMVEPGPTSHKPGPPFLMTTLNCERVENSLTGAIL